MDPDSSRVRVTVTDGRGRPVRSGGLARWLSSIAPARVRGEIAIALVSDGRVQALNRRYRRKNAPTDVLAFAEPDGHPRPEPRTARDEPRFLGDLVIATGVARRQAREAGHPYPIELRVLALHGLLHLLGYDHERAEDAGRMARVEARLRKKGGLETGLIARNSPQRPKRERGARRS